MKSSKILKIFGRFNLLGKKGGGATGLVMAFGSITIVIISLFFLMTIQENRSEGNFETLERKVDDQITLLNYLRTPVDADHDVADMMMMYKMTGEVELKQIAVQKAREALDPLYKITDCSWRVILDDEELIKVKNKHPIFRSAEQDIMLLDGKKAKVELETCG